MKVASKTAGPLARGVLLAMLLSSAASAALAAPGPQDPRLDAMQAQLDQMRAELGALRAGAGTDARVEAMQAQLDGFARQLAELKTAQTAGADDIVRLQAQAAAKPAGDQVIASLPNGRPSLATADGRFTANLRTVVMFDAGKYFQDSDLPPSVTNGRNLNSGTNFRRARFGVDGRLYGDIDYALIYEFGGSGAEDAGHIQEAWGQYNGFKPWRIRLGAFEPNIGLAAATSTSQMALLERPSPAEVARNVAAGDTRSALQVAGNGLFSPGVRWFASGALTGGTVGTISSTGGAAAQPAGEQTALIGRVAIAPFSAAAWQAHLGVNAQYVLHPADAGPSAAPRYPVQLRDRPELRLDAVRLVDTGAIDARRVRVLGAEGAFAAGPLVLEGEYFRFDVTRREGATALPDPTFDGWYLQGAWSLTGERRTYNPAEARFDAPRPARNFDPATGGWGALELGVRYSNLDLNDRDCGAGQPIAACGPGAIRGGRQSVSTLGLNWYWNPAIRFMLDYQHVDVDRFTAAGAQGGESYEALTLRSQLTF